MCPTWRHSRIQMMEPLKELQERCCRLLKLGVRMPTCIPSSKCNARAFVCINRRRRWIPQFISISECTQICMDDITHYSGLGNVYNAINLWGGNIWTIGNDTLGHHSRTAAHIKKTALRYAHAYLHVSPLLVSISIRDSEHIEWWESLQKEKLWKVQWWWIQHHFSASPFVSRDDQHRGIMIQ